MESTAQMVLLPRGSAGTITYERAGTLPATQGNSAAQHGARAEGPGMPQGTASKQGRDRGIAWLFPPEQPHQESAGAVLYLGRDEASALQWISPTGGSGQPALG